MKSKKYVIRLKNGSRIHFSNNSKNILKGERMKKPKRVVLGEGYLKHGGSFVILFKKGKSLTKVILLRGGEIDGRKIRLVAELL